MIQTESNLKASVLSSSFYDQELMYKLPSEGTINSPTKLWNL